MLATLNKKDEGFTLIEIVLVLAIAGLILLIVFLAVGGAQRARRDQQRKSDNARVASQLEQFASNNSGCYPDTGGTVGCPAGVGANGTATANFWTPYITSANNFTDPLTGTAYTFVDDSNTWNAMTAFGAGPAQVRYTYARDCSGGAQGNRIYAVRISLETGFGCNTNR